MSDWTVSRFHAKGYPPVFDVVRYPHQGTHTPEQVAGGFASATEASAIAAELNQRGSPVCNTIDCTRPGVIVTSAWYARCNGISYRCIDHHGDLTASDSTGYPYQVYITEIEAAR